MHVRVGVSVCLYVCMYVCMYVPPSLFLCHPVCGMMHIKKHV